MNVSCYLRSPKSDTTTVVGQVYIGGRKMQFGIAVKVPSAKWNKRTQRLNTGGRPGLVDLNRRIDIEVAKVIELYQSLASSGTVTVDRMKAALSGKPSKESTDSFLDWVASYIEQSDSRTNNSGQRISYRTIQKYRTVESKLRQLAESVLKRDLLFTDWNEELLRRYIELRAAEGIGVNTAAKDVAVIRLWLKRAFIDGAHENRAFMSDYFTPKKRDPKKVYLTVEDLTDLERASIPQKMRSNVRDLFLVACWTGLRISDLKRLPEVLRQNTQPGGALPDFVRFVQAKTGDSVIVNILDPVKRIAAKHDGTLPRVYAGPVMNREIKKALRDAGVIRAVEVVDTSFDNKPPRMEPLCDLVTMHTARRTFATNMYVEAGLSAREVMTLTGHRSESALLTYLNISRDQTAQDAGRKLSGRF